MSAPMRAATAALLEAMGDAYADPRYRTAAGILRGAPAGRRAIDDDLPLSLAADLIATGRAGSRREAARLVARVFAGSGDPRAMQERLRKKLENK